MSRVWYTSDTHFGHERIIKLCARPFESVEEMDAGLVELWNEVVGPNDIVFHLGDVTGGSTKPLEHVSKLNGRKILIAGNHDACHPMHREWLKHLPLYLSAGFEAVMPFARRKVAGRTLLMSHFPYGEDHTDTPRYNQYRLRDEGELLVHGHVHTLYMLRGRGFNVGVDMNGFQPVPEDEVIYWMRENSE